MAEKNRNQGMGQQGNPAQEKGQGSGQQTAGTRGQKQKKKIRNTTAVASKKNNGAITEAIDKS
jgi:hypothetical protein